MNVDKRNKTHPSQWTSLLDFAEENPVILTKKFEGLKGKQMYQNLWKQLTVILNSMGYNEKTTEKWQKAVADWKSKVKVKAQNIRKSFNQTGGGGAVPPLTENEERLMSLIGWSSVHGDDNMEMGAGQVRTEKENNSNEFHEEFHKYALRAANDEEATTSTGGKASSPPPLVYLSSYEEIPANEISANEIPAHEIPANEIPGTKRKKQANRITKRKCKEKFTPYVQQMHNETLTILTDISNNIKRIADNNQKLCEIHEHLLQQVIQHLRR